ncbi:hypothetical protein GCM10009639_51670 [Kitasatospora putterlickiae]|uniref:Uncharacterized protein n=1 Tax=Kitasatospora putterlickiae TaxID=221725 RepID=A0ABN1YI15_9ACTN
MPKPISRPARLVKATAGRDIIFMSTSGWATLASMTPQTRATTAATANRPRVLLEVQPQVLPWLTATSRAESQPARVRAPSGSAPPSLSVTGSVGTRRATRAIAIRPKTRPIQKMDL